MVDMIPAEIVFRGGSNPKRYAIIEDATGKCVNVVDWDPAAEPAWSPPPGFTAVQDDTREIDPPPPVVPGEVSNAKGRLALVGAGLFAQVDALAEAAGKQSPLFILWNHSPVWSRSSSTIAALAAQLGLTDEQVDALFIAADRIET